MRYSVCFSMAAILLWSCHSKPSSDAINNNSPESAQAKTSFTAFKKGVVIDSVICNDDATQIYSLYLPSNYDTNRKWPIIYFFDPHGVGYFPVVLYKNLAEKYGFILAGTYNSKNGMQFENTEKAARAFMQDTRKRLSINNNRVYTFGFSGGAMVASMVAMTEGGIAGVVACGGSLPGDHPPIKQPFSYISFVGNKDFHYMPAMQLDRLLDSTSLSHQLIVFNGGHQWPPVDCIEQAFQWLDMDAMRTKAMPENDSIIKSVEKQFMAEAENEHKKGNAVQEYYTYEKLFHFMRNVDDGSNYATKARQLQNTQALKKYFSEEETMEMTEAQQMDDFRNHLSQMDQDWWNAKIADMEKQFKMKDGKIIGGDTNSPQALQTQRLLGYLSLAMYMGASEELNEHNYPAAVYFVGLYAKVDPQNPEHFYMSATLDMTDNNFAGALTMLNNAVKLGFSDSKRLEHDSAFVALHNMPEYKKLLKEMTSKPEKVDMTK